MLQKKLLFTLMLAVSMCVLALNVQAQMDTPPSTGPAPFVYNSSDVPEIFFPFHPGHNAFSFHATSLTSSTLQKYDLGTPGTRTTIGSSHTYFFGGADIAPLGGVGTNYVLYTAQQLAPYNLFIIDTTTGAETPLPNVTGITLGGNASLTGMTWDMSTSTMFIVATNIQQSQLYTLNVITGVATAVGQPQSIAPGLIGIACANIGTLFGYDLVTDMAYKINKTTGTPTVIGPIGFNANFGQDCAWDHISGTWYLAAFNGGTFQPELRICDTTTGNSTLVGPFTGATQMLGTGIPGGFAPPVAVPLCQGFSDTTFPPSGWSRSGNPSYWLRSPLSSFGQGTGSAQYDMWNAVAGTNQTFTTPFHIRPTGNQTLSLDIAYAPFGNPPYTQDSLIILTSTDAGTTYTSLLRWGPMELKTTAPQGTEFFPTANQWARRCITLPDSTNKIQFLGKSGFGNHLYLDSICIRGGCTPLGIAENNNGQIPQIYSLYQNYPNPFNPITKISYGLPKAGNVKLVLYDILGREVQVLVNEYKLAGIYNYQFDASHLSSGVYFYKLESGSFTDTKKMLLIK